MKFSIGFGPSSNAIRVICFVLLSIVLNNSCKKQDDFLNIKSANSQVVPSSISDYQAILDYTSTMNAGYPTAGLLGADNYYLSNNVFNSLSAPYSTAYIWASDVWRGAPSGDWNSPYKVIEYANVALNGMANIKPDSSTKSAFNNVEGSALFYRAFAYYNLATIFCKSYNPATAGTDLGLPLRMTADVNVRDSRSTVQQTYTQILNDLQQSLSLLPVKASFPSRPSVVASNALLSKVYLDMGDYTNALKYVKLAISSSGNLLDFNSSLVKPSSTVPFPTILTANPEIIFWAAGQGYTTVWCRGTGIVDSNLYNSYNSNDLRRTVFFQLANGLPQFKGTYDNSGRQDFCGIATNELYLIRAECFARNNDAADAISDLNTLLSKRYRTGSFSQIPVQTTDSALRIVLSERRKELPFTSNIPWEDLRRLAGTAQGRVITRFVNGTLYMLSPGDPKYVLPIPNNEIQVSGLEQNPR